MMANKLIRALFVYSLALIYGFMVCVVILLRAIWNLEIPTRGKRREKPPSCLLDPELGEHHFLRTASNIRIHYVAKGDTGKQLMLCLHGFPEFWYSWRYQLKAFSDNFRVVAVDLRGYGESDSPKGREHYKTSLLVNDIKEIIEALGYTSCTLLSHDWGGALAWTFAHMHPEFVDKLIACNIPYPRCFFQPSKPQFFRTWYFCYIQLPYLPEFETEVNDYRILSTAFKDVGFADEEVEAYKYALSQNGLSGPLNYYRNAVLPDAPWGLLNTKIKAPTLVVWGTADTFITLDTLEGTEEYVEDLTIKYVDGASHWVQVHKPEVVNQHIRDFLAVQRN
ncbi:epoxide hydrolase 4-like [Porites lutea]|uniref:epoxide hydrolase 4-like n=1 Tax=Porites lutea TaxID=51062 RepID=UPI003CC66A42